MSLKKDRVSVSARDDHLEDYEYMKHTTNLFIALEDTYPHPTETKAFESLFRAVFHRGDPETRYRREDIEEFIMLLFKYLDTPRVDVNMNDYTSVIAHDIPFPYSEEFPFDRKKFLNHRSKQLTLWRQGKFRKTVDGDYKCGNVYFHKYYKYPHSNEKEARELTLKSVA
jgi:hypothetical protein